MTTNPPTQITSPAFPGATFALWRGWDADRQVREHLGAGAKLARWPHHTSSRESLLSRLRGVTQGADNPTGYILQPGEILLAGAGVLVLQDLAEFRREVIEAVARAWREGELLLGAGGQPDHLRVPVRCSIHATAQQCPCGMKGRPGAPLCACTEGAMKRWSARVDDAVKLFRGVRRTTATRAAQDGEA